MKYFIGIVPPQQISEKIRAFQGAWKNSSFLSLVEPHVTVKAQNGLTEDFRWLPDVTEAAKKFPPLEVTLGAPAALPYDSRFLKRRLPRPATPS